MKIKKFLVIGLLFLLIPFISVKAEENVTSNNEEDTKEVKVVYRDVVADIVGNKDTSKVTVYFFHQTGCPHCEAETEFLNSIKKKYDFNILRYEVSSNETNNKYLDQVKARFMQKNDFVPFTVIGTKYFTGYNDYLGSDIEDAIKLYLGIDVPKNNGEENPEVVENSKTLPLLGKVNMKDVSIPLVAVVLGLVDGFNPCAMWILLFLISMLFHMKSRKRMWLLGLTFLFTSAFVYFLAMLGINSLLSVFNIKYIKILISLVALIGGIINIRSFIITKDTGCNVVDDKKRKKYFEKIKKFTSEKSIILALIGVIALAASVNLVELACSAGFPTIFIELLNLNNITGITSIMYILLYILFFLIDDIVIFVIAMVTLEATGISTKYNRLSHLIGGILMILIGILLILKPEWLMFNF